MIRIYPSKLQGEPLETHHIGQPMTIAAWLRANVKNYSEREIHPISFEVNGALVPSAEWDRFVIKPDDVVDVTPEPKEPISATALAIYAAVAVAAVALVITLMPKPQMKSSGGVTRGDELNEASAKGNKVKINSPIREVAGKRRVYPDYLLPPHRFFSSPRDQWVEMLLCVGKGKFEIPASRILVGDTPLISLGSDAEYKIYQPGQSLAGNTAAEWWHTAEEVGATATGSAGLELTATYAVEPQPSATSYIFSGDTITIPSGAGSFPAGWAPGMIVRIEAPRPYTVVDGGADRDIIQGALAWMTPFPGMVIEVAGDYAGSFVVHSYTPGAGVPDEITLDYPDGSPVTALPVGSPYLTIGYAGLRYRLVAASTTAISVERLTDTGGPDVQEWLGFDDFNSADALITLDASTQEGDWTGPFMACPANELASHIEWDVMFPGGIVGVDKKGRKFYVSVTVEMQYRDSAVAGAWTSVRKTYTAAQADQLGYTESLQLPSMMRPEVRLRRIGAKSDSTQIIDGVEWYGLRAKLQAPTVYEGVTTIAVRVKGGKRLAAQTEQQLSAEVTRVLPVRTGEGTWDVETPTRDIVPFVAYVARSIGYTDDDLDFDELDRLGELWAQRGDHFDMTYESASTVKQIIGHALKAGYADLTIERGRLSAARDEVRGSPEQTFVPRTDMYTPQNMTEELERDFSAVGPDDFDGVDVEYVDETTWAVETVECRLPGDIGRKVEKLTAEGITSRTRAWRLGMRQRMAHKHRRWAYRWATELDALNSGFMSFCHVADDVPGYGQSALMLSYDNGIIESSEPFDWSAGGAHVVGIRRPDGTLSGPYAATRIDDYRLSITGLDFEPDTSWSIEPPHLLFGPVNRWSYPALITSISPSGTDGASVEAVNYAPEVYTYDNASAPN
ncbi:host specificity factor TipJ family phage tail protein [Pseudomonas aeruginosa]|uniref:host specificity factor TipJ family phage tail protein n=1 Tax=Pseudomonas aeruginosa TaxID=287 RepID=UPI0035C0745B